VRARDRESERVRARDRESERAREKSESESGARVRTRVRERVRVRVSESESILHTHNCPSTQILRINQEVVVNLSLSEENFTIVLLKIIISKIDTSTKKLGCCPPPYCFPIIFKPDHNTLFRIE
jgi:hypothetical protein